MFIIMMIIKIIRYKLRSKIRKLEISVRNSTRDHNGNKALQFFCATPVAIVFSIYLYLLCNDIFFCIFHIWWQNKPTHPETDATPGIGQNCKSDKAWMQFVSTMVDNWQLLAEHLFLRWSSLLYLFMQLLQLRMVLLWISEYLSNLDCNWTA